MGHTKKLVFLMFGAYNTTIAGAEEHLGQTYEADLLRQSGLRFEEPEQFAKLFNDGRVPTGHFWIVPAYVLVSEGEGDAPAPE